MASLSRLPKELLHNITLRLHDARDLVSLSLTCWILKDFIDAVQRERTLGFSIGEQTAFRSLPWSFDDMNLDIHTKNIGPGGFKTRRNPDYAIGVHRLFVSLCRSRKLATHLRHARLHLGCLAIQGSRWLPEFPSDDWKKVRQAVKWLKLSAIKQFHFLRRLWDREMTAMVLISLWLLPNLEILEVEQLDLLVNDMTDSISQTPRTLCPSLSTLFYSVNQRRHAAPGISGWQQHATLKLFLRSAHLRHVFGLGLDTSEEPSMRLYDLSATMRQPETCPSLTSLSLFGPMVAMEAFAIEAILANLPNLEVLRCAATTINGSGLERGLMYVSQTLRCLHIKCNHMPYRHTDQSFTSFRLFPALKILCLPWNLAGCTNVDDLRNLLPPNLEFLGFFTDQHSGPFTRRIFSVLMELLAEKLQFGSPYNLSKIRLRSFSLSILEAAAVDLRQTCINTDVALLLEAEPPPSSFDYCDYRNWDKLDTW